MLHYLTMSLAAMALSSDPVPSVIHVVIDDLGYHDLNFRNGQTETPVMDKMVRQGVEIKEFYVYKMCAPSRASVLTGRYPYHLGFYGNNGGINSGVDLRFKLLPELLKPAGWATHALGKWHIGWGFRSYTPTWRGFDTFLGSSGNTGDYWYHFAETGSCDSQQNPWKGPITDIVDAREARSVVPPANQTGVNGTYDARLLTNRAEEIIATTPQDTPLYMYLAFHNVHVPMQAPLETVRRFPLVTHDARKVADAMLLEVDWGLGNVTRALKRAGRYDGAVFIVHTDNGGPGSHACNWPHRGGKFSFWEGGVRGLAFVSGPLLPQQVWGTQFKGLAHLADVYLTVAAGIAGVSVPSGSTGPIEHDSYNLWPALRSGGDSPRLEVVHLPFPNQYVNTTDDVKCAKNASQSGHGCAPSMRSGKYKIIYTWPGGDQLIELTPLSKSPVEYGHTKGIVRNGDQALGPHWSGYKKTSQAETCDPFCVFDVSTDLGESHNLAKDPSLSDTISAMEKRLTEEATTGAPVCDFMQKHDFKKLYMPIICENVKSTGGYWLPVDWDGSDVPPAPAPTPPPLDCQTAMREACPWETYPEPKACRQCCKDHKAEDLASCHPKDFNAYCNNTIASIAI
jgi:arylsulfatase A-like enzyme